MAISQVQAVVNAVADVLGDSFVTGTTVVSDVLTADQKKQVRRLVKASILNGEVSCSKDPTNLGEFNRYVNGMINNHLMKSKKLNGNSPYKPKKKGSPRDPQLKEFSKLLKTLAPGSDEHAQVVSAINTRRAELSAKSPKNVDASIIPGDIAAAIGLVT